MLAKQNEWHWWSTKARANWGLRVMLLGYGFVASTMSWTSTVHGESREVSLGRVRFRFLKAIG